jgi:phage shock protein A
MDNSSTTHGNGEAGLSVSAAGELEALLAATEQAAEELKGRARQEIDTALADLTTLVAELRDAADRLEERLTGIRAGVGAEPAAPNEQDATRRARLIAVNMAANGASRAETARYLSERLGIRDREALLDSVYESLGGE